ncbi:hypothetical protein LJC47_07890, partial [Desulfosarcina sp. OttesenSCG-928-B08]|nr:hypothetical protein [Desulfosarcina sp. OttesenSCG-928-B08]
MSTGAIAGGVVGAVAGFVVAGPYGMAAGMMLGMAVGMMIDPIDTGAIAKPDMTDLSAPTAAEDKPIADLCGTTMVANAANFLFYANNWTKEIKAESGGKGGGQEYTEGYHYYLTFGLGIGMGPIYALYSINEDNQLIWSAGDTPLTIDDAVNGHVTLTIYNRGTIDFYFGTPDQPASPAMTAAIGYELPYPGLCYAVFNDFMIGTYNRAGSFKFCIKKYPDDAGTGVAAIAEYDANPALALRYILVEKLRISTDRIDEAGFAAAAQVLSDEERGISGLFTGESPAIDYMEIILFHIRGCLYTTAEGKISIRLYRRDMSPEDMITIDET